MANLPIQIHIFLEWQLYKQLGGNFITKTWQPIMFAPRARHADTSPTTLIFLVNCPWLPYYIENGNFLTY